VCFVAERQLGGRSGSCELETRESSLAASVLREKLKPLPVPRWLREVPAPRGTTTPVKVRVRRVLIKS
jgi:hypothetical protein